MSGFIAFAAMFGPTIVPLLFVGVLACWDFRDSALGRAGLIVLGGAAVLIAGTDIMCR